MVVPAAFIARGERSGGNKDPRVDAVRGCVAVERGTLVYCIEAADAPECTEIEELPLGSGAGARSRSRGRT